MSADFIPSRNTYKTLGSFRFWCQKVLPQVYDDSLSYYELLNKVVDYLNEVNENADGLNDDVTAMYTAFKQLQDYINDWFSDLSVQEQVDNKIQSMVDSGEFKEIVDAFLQPLFDKYAETSSATINAAITRQDTSIANAVSAQNTEIDNATTRLNDRLTQAVTNQNTLIGKNTNAIDVLESRVDAITSLPSGSTSGDAELTDIRVAYTGATYASAGDAVRAQAENNHNGVVRLNNLIGDDYTVGSDIIATGLQTGYKINNVGVAVAAASAKIDSYPVVAGSVISVELYADFDDCTYIFQNTEAVTTTVPNMNIIGGTVGGIFKGDINGFIKVPEGATYLCVSSNAANDVNSVKSCTRNVLVGTDTTLSISGKAADAKATGDALGNLKSDLNAPESLLIGDGKSNVDIWEEGSISGVGGNIASSARIRTKNNRLIGFSQGHLKVSCSSDYEMFLSAYDLTGTYVGRIQTDGQIGSGDGAWSQEVNLINYSSNLFRVVLRNKNDITATMTVAEASNVLFHGEKYVSKSDISDINPYVYDEISVTLESGIYDRWNNFTNVGKHCSVSVSRGDKYIITTMSYASTDYPLWVLIKGNTVVAYQNVASAQMTQVEMSVDVDADTLIINSHASYISLQKGEIVKAKPYSKWHGKKIAWFGTSIPETSTYNAVLGYPEYVGRLLGATVYNEARGSSCARRGFKSAQSANDPYGWTGMGYKGALYNMGSSHEEKQELLDNWDTKWKALVGGDHTLTDGDRTLAMYYSYETVLQQHITTPVDLYVFDHGYNDWSANAVNMEMNENDPFDRSTYQGAMNTFIKLILTANPRAKILLLSHYETQERPTLVPMQKSVAEYWNLPFCEICNYLGWANDRTITTDGYWSNGTGNGIWIASGGTEQTYTLKQLHIPDGRHPNTDISGHACIDIANIIADFINTISPTD